MKISSQGLVSIFLLVTGGTVNAYELATHGRLTYEAYKRSVLSDVQVLSDWGLKNGNNPFGKFYYDVSGSTVNERSRQLFEQQADRIPRGTEPLSLEGWLMRGAIREDDLPSPIGKNPQDDPYGNIWRVFNHFYDPIFDRALTGRDGQGNPIAPMAEDRNKYWATTFRALGDVVHLLQDMAQPQHTRNLAGDPA